MSVGSTPTASNNIKFMSEKVANTGAGKGDKPRNCFSKEFKDNYDLIDWSKKNKKNESNNTSMPSADSMRASG